MNDPYGLASSGLPPDMLEEATSLARRQQIMQALLAQSQQPYDMPQAVGRFAPRASPLQGVAKILQSYVASQGLKDADKGFADLSQRRTKLVSDALLNYERTKAGAPAVTPLTPNDDEGNAMPSSPAIPGSTRAALTGALSNPLISSNPMVLADMKSMEKATEPYSLKQGEKRIVGDKVVAENAPKAQEHVIGGMVYVIDPTTGKLVLKGGPGDPMAFNRPFNADGSPNLRYQQYEKDKALLGSTKVQTQVNAFTPASEEAQRKFMDSTRTTYDALKQAPVALESIERAKELIPQAKGFMGPGGEGLLEATKFLNNRLGLNIDTKGVKDAEELRTRIFFNVMDNLKKMDAQPSEMQQRMMTDALGKLGTDPNALPQVLDAFADVIKGKVELHNNEVAGAVQRGIKFPYDPTIKLPTPKRRAADKNTIRFDAQGNRIP